jgi:hypothetical protein
MPRTAVHRKLCKNSDWPFVAMALWNCAYCSLLLIAQPSLAAKSSPSPVPIEERPTPAPKATKNSRQKVVTPKPGFKKPPKKHPELIPPPNDPNAAQIGEPDAVEILYPDQLGEHVSSLVVSLANRLDSFFGDERSDDEKNGSTLRLTPSYTFYDKRKGVAELGVNLNLKLRNLETKAKHLEQTLRDEILESDTAQAAGANTPKSIKKEEDTWHYNFESKLASRPAIYYSGKFRVRKNFDRDFFLHHFSASAGWDTDDAWTQRITFNSDHALNEILLFRFSNDANWFITNEHFQTTHGPSLIQTINKYNSVSYNFRLVFGDESNRIHHLDSVYSVNYRHGTPSKRIFVDLIPAFNYPRSDHYHEVRSFEIRFEYYFGDLS